RPAAPTWDDTLSAPAPAKPAAPAGADAGAETTQTTVPASSAPDRTRAEDAAAPGAPSAGTPSAEAPFDQETAPETGVVEEPPSAVTSAATPQPAAAGLAAAEA